MDKYSHLFSNNYMEKIIEIEDNFIEVMSHIPVRSIRYNHMLLSFINKKRLHSKRYVCAKAAIIIKHINQNKIAMLYIPKPVNKNNIIGG